MILAFIPGKVGLAALIALVVIGWIYGLVLRVREDGFAEGIVAPFLRLAPWFAIVVGLFVGAVALWYLGKPLLMLAGVGAGVVFSLMALGYDALFDRLWPSFYASACWAGGVRRTRRRGARGRPTCRPPVRPCGPVVACPARPSALRGGRRRRRWWWRRPPPPRVRRWCNCCCAPIGSVSRAPPPRRRRGPVAPAPSPSLAMGA